MPVVTELDLPFFDTNDPDLRGDRFHDEIEALRAKGWLANSPLAVMVLDREAGSFFLRTRSATFPGMKIAEIFGIEEGPLYEEMERNILHINGEDHGRLRRLVNPFFTPRAANRWRPVMREYVERLWAPMAEKGGGDFVADFAKPYPSLTIAAVMGAAEDDAERLHHWSNWIQRQFDGPALMDPDERAKIEEAVTSFYEYANGLLRRRRGDPGEDLVSALIAAEEEGDRLADVETLNLVTNVLVGGVDTTQSQLAQGIRLFALHPDQWELLAEKPELTPRAVEEILRYEPITPFTARMLHEEVTYREVTFPAETIVLIAAVTGNRDPDDTGTNPADFDITVDRDQKPLTFGAGPHFCLGSNLAKAEMEEALTYLAPRMRDLELAGEPVFGSIQGIYGLDELPVRFRAESP